MLKEFVELLLKTGQDTVRSQVSSHPTDPDKRLVIGPKGVEVIDTPRVDPGTSSTCNTIEDFKKAIQAQDYALQSVIWYSESGAEICSIDPFRLHTIRIFFPPSPILQSVLELRALKWFDQRSLLRFLRISLAGCAEDVVVSRFRQLNWESARRTKQIITHGKSSLDADVQASVKAGDAEAPEAFLIEFPLFASMKWKHITHTAQVAVDLDVEQCKIGLCLLPGTEEAIVEAQRMAVYNALDDELNDEDYTLIGGEYLRG